MVRPYVRRWKFVNHLPPRKTSAHEVFGWIVVRLVFLTTAMICLEDLLSLVLCPSGSWLCSWWASVLWAVLSLMHIIWGCFLQAWMVAFLRDPSGHKDPRLQTSPSKQWHHFPVYRSHPSTPSVHVLYSGVDRRQFCVLSTAAGTSVLEPSP